jgi:hypothetical protein
MWGHLAWTQLCWHLTMRLFKLIFEIMGNKVKVHYYEI